MSADAVELTLSSDKPLLDPSNDQLGHAPFAKRMAAAIVEAAPADGMVVGIYSPWGTGKTTALNFIEYYINQTPEQQRPVVIWFNPWWFSGHEDLTKRFLEHLRTKLKLYNRFRQVAEKLGDLADGLSEIPVSYVPAWIRKAVLRRLFPHPMDVPQLKADISKRLSQVGARIVVVIDDIDRLTAEEIRQLFRSVKAVADFPCVTYLLAFDKAVVADALGQGSEEQGRLYLEKIVQVPFDLPQPDRTAIRTLLFARLDATLEGTPNELFNQDHWANVFWDGIDRLVCTPRDVVRVTNALSVTYPSVRGEVNAVDFIAIEVLRVLCPEAYMAVRDRQELFAGSGHPLLAGQGDLAALRQKQQDSIDCAPEARRPAVRLLLSRLFPRVEGAHPGASLGPDGELQSKRERRICCADVCGVFFRLSLPTGAVSRQEVLRAIGLAQNPDGLASLLIRMSKEVRPDGATRARALLEDLQAYTESAVPESLVAPIAEVLMEVGDDLVAADSSRRGVLDLEMEIDVSRVIWQLLRRLEEPLRYETLRRVIVGGGALGTVIREIALRAQPDECKPPGPHAEELSAVHLQELQLLAAGRIRTASSDGSLLTHPDLLRILNRWGAWASLKEPTQWLQGITETDDGLVQFLVRCLQTTQVHTSGGVKGRTQPRLDPNWIEGFLDPDSIAARAEAIGQRSDLEGEQRLAIDQFLKEYDLRKQGKDPGFSLAHGS